MSEWIDIKDKLPPEKILHSIYIVNIYSSLKHTNFVYPLHYINGQWFEMFYEEPLSIEYEVTHWMPLPEKP